MAAVLLLSEKRQDLPRRNDTGRLGGVLAQGLVAGDQDGRRLGGEKSPEVSVAGAEERAGRRGRLSHFAAQRQVGEEEVDIGFRESVDPPDATDDDVRVDDGGRRLLRRRRSARVSLTAKVVAAASPSVERWRARATRSAACATVLMPAWARHSSIIAPIVLPRRAAVALRAQYRSSGKVMVSRAIAPPDIFSPAHHTAG
jgi:hypothetical protein